MPSDLLEVLQTEAFRQWFRGLRDAQAQNRVRARIRRLVRGNFGDARSVGSGVSELRIHYGPGYRIYYVRRGLAVVILLAGGDKSSQRDDIQRARQLALDPGVLEERLW